MAHIFSHASKSDYSGDGIDEWFKKNITENVKFSSGDILDCVDISGNRVKCNRSGVGLIMSGSRIEKHKSLIVIFTQSYFYPKRSIYCISG